MFDQRIIALDAFAQRKVLKKSAVEADLAHSPDAMLKMMTGEGSL